MRSIVCHSDPPMEAALPASFTTSPSCSSSQSATYCKLTALHLPCTFHIPLPLSISFSEPHPFLPPHSDSLLSSVSSLHSISTRSVTLPSYFTIHQSFSHFYFTCVLLFSSAPIVWLPLSHLTDPWVSPHCTCWSLSVLHECLWQLWVVNRKWPEANTPWQARL